MIQTDSPFVFDVVGRMLTDTAYAKQVNEAYARCQAAYAALKDGNGSRTSVQETVGRLVEASGFNIGFIIPSIFPRTVLDPETNEMLPLDYQARPYMFALSSLVTDATVTMVTGRQVGKCLRGDTTIETNLGDVSMADLFAMGCREDEPLVLASPGSL